MNLISVILFPACHTYNRFSNGVFYFRFGRSTMLASALSNMALSLLMRLATLIWKH